MKKLLTIAAGATLLSAPVLAQDAGSAAQSAPSEPQAGMAAEAGASTFTDEEISVYAKAAVEIDKMHSDATLDAEARQSGALAVLQQSGLAPERFNEISDASRSDPELAQRVQLAIADAQGQPGA